MTLPTATRWHSIPSMAREGVIQPLQQSTTIAIPKLAQCHFAPEAFFAQLERPHETAGLERSVSGWIKTARLSSYLSKHRPNYGYQIYVQFSQCRAVWFEPGDTERRAREEGRD